MPKKPLVTKKATSPSNLKINFLRGDGSNMATQAIGWITKVGLPILYVVAAIVFSASFYKLYLDDQLIGLEEEILAAADTTRTYQALEKELNSITSKYSDVEDYWLAEKITLLLPKLTQDIPLTVTINDLKLSPSDVSFSGFTVDKAAAYTLLNNITAVQNTVLPGGQTVEFYDIALQNIGTTNITDSSFNFSINFKYSIIDNPTPRQVTESTTPNIN